MICTFNTNKVGVYSISSGHLLLYSEQRQFSCESSFIDEAGCLISMLDETKTKINIFVVDWKYNVEKPPERKRRHSTLNSLESGSDKGDRDMLHSKDSWPKKSAEEIKDMNKLNKK